MRRSRIEARLQNLELLVSEAGSASKLARLAETSESYLSQIRTQLTTPQGTARGVGDRLADKLERAMHKPHGWMDEPHPATRGMALRLNPGTSAPFPIAGKAQSPPSASSEATPDMSQLYPLISWDQLVGPPGHSAIREVAEDWLPCPVPCNDGTFVLRVKGESMEPKFHDGDLIFVDPEVPPSGGRYVVASLEGDREATFRQLIVEGGRRYLKALNPDWPERIVEMDEDTVIRGVVVFKGEVA